MTTLQHESTATVLEPVRKRSGLLWLALVGLCLAQISVMFEAMAGLATLTTVYIDMGDVPWETGDGQITAYCAAVAALLWFGGRLCDRIGMDRAFLIGGIGFAALTVLMTFSVNGPMWWGVRAGQAVFTAILLPAVLGLITMLCPLPGLRAKVLTAYCTVTMAGMAIGYCYGSTLVPTAPDSWQRPMFLAAGATVLALLMTTPALVRFKRAGDPGPLGLPALVPGIAVLIVAFAYVSRNGWLVPVSLGLLVLAAVLVATAYWIARKPPNWPGPAPKPTRRGVTLGIVLMQAGGWGIIFPLYQFQYVMAEDFTKSAVKMGVPYICGLLVFAVPALMWAHRVGPRIPIVVGLVWTGIGLGIFSRLGIGSNYETEALPALALVGGGVMAAFVAATLTALGGTTDSQAGRFGARWSGLILFGVVCGAGVLGLTKKFSGEIIADGRYVGDPAVLETAYGNALIAGCAMSILGAVAVWFVLRPMSAPAAVGAAAPAPVQAAAPVQVRELVPAGAGAPVAPALSPRAACGIVGSVRNTGGVALPGIVLTLIDPVGREMGRTTTDDAGNYFIETPDGGDFMMVSTGTAAFEPSAGLVTVHSGLRRHEIVLRGGSSVFGHVRSGARPVPGAAVTLTDGEGSVHATAETGLDGHFEVDGLVIGRYTLSAVTAGLPPVARAIELTGARLHQDLEMADVAAGNGHSRRHPLCGFVRSAHSERGVPWALVTLTEESGVSLSSTRTAQDGSFRFDHVPLGPYRLTTTIYHQESVLVDFSEPEADDTVILIDQGGRWTQHHVGELLS